MFLFVIFSFSLVVLWSEWTRQNQTAQSVEAVSTNPALPPAVSVDPPKATASINAAEPLKPSTGKKVIVKTDTFMIEFNTTGANVERVELLQHKTANDQNKSIVLLQHQDQLTYIAQSGLLGHGLPTHNAEFQTDSDEFALVDGQNNLVVKFTALGIEGARVAKTYTFHKGSYLVDVGYEIENTGTSTLTPSAYFQLIRDSSLPEGASSFVPTYTGGAVYTELEKLQKIEFTDIDKNKIKLPKDSKDGWVGMVQHYFVSAWLPKNNTPREFYVKHLDGNLYSVGVILPTETIEPKQSFKFETPLYVGPAKSKLDEITPGLGLTVDYGIFTVFAAPLFWLMSFLNDWVNNWGVAIVLLTVLIKLAFFPLSATSYRSMAKMRVVAPKLEKIKKQYGDDRERLNKAMMDLYKTEKINPLGGCLPVLIQIPVFIGLYWAILESVELRHAPFIGWITDLSATDPYYILPIIMGASMLIQSKLNPVPADPIQAKIMQIMPIAFSVVFFFFPAGLVLYSIVNNILSIAQQWYITHGEEAAQKGGSKI